MRVLLDECVPRRLAEAFGASHSVDTVTGLGWASTKNGDLLQLAAAKGFEAVFTVDVRMSVPRGSELRLFVLRAASNRLEALVPLMPKLLERLKAAAPGVTEEITIGNVREG